MCSSQWIKEKQKQFTKLLHKLFLSLFFFCCCFILIYFFSYFCGCCYFALFCFTFVVNWKWEYLFVARCTRICTETKSNRECFIECCHWCIAYGTMCSKQQTTINSISNWNSIDYVERKKNWKSVKNNCTNHVQTTFSTGHPNGSGFPEGMVERGAYKFRSNRWQRRFSTKCIPTNMYTHTYTVLLTWNDSIHDFSLSMEAAEPPVDPWVCLDRPVVHCDNVDVGGGDADDRLVVRVMVTNPN